MNTAVQWADSNPFRALAQCPLWVVLSKSVHAEWMIIKELAEKRTMGRVNNQIFLLLSLVLFSNLIFANPFCNAILQNGVYDEESFLDSLNSYNLAKSVHCSKSLTVTDRASGSSGNIEFDGFTFGTTTSYKNKREQSNAFCNGNYDEYRKSTVHQSAVKKINQGIVAAWNSCINNNLS